MGAKIDGKKAYLLVSQNQVMVGVVADVHDAFCLGRAETRQAQSGCGEPERD